MACLGLRVFNFKGRSKQPVTPRDTTFQVELRCEGPERFGMVLGGHPEVPGLVIVDTSDSKAVMRWNDEHPGEKIQIGYAVMQVNGITETQGMLQELRDAKSATVVVKMELCSEQLAVLKRSMEMQRRNVVVEKNLTKVTDACHCGEACSICHDEMDGTAEAQLPCGHRFHKACVRKWLISGSLRCPLCNHDIGMDNCNN